MNRWEETETESKSDADEQNADDRDAREENGDRTEPARPLIDQDLAGSVNAAVPDTDD
jgi:hypothetical protein